MPQLLTITTLKTVVQEEQVVPSTAQLALEFGTPTQSSRVVVILGARNEYGEWRSEIAPVRVELTDRMELPGDNIENRLATAVGNLIFDAIVPETPQTIAMGFAGLTVRQMGAAVIAQLIEGQQQVPEPEPE